MSGDSMIPLTQACIEVGFDYHRARALIIRGEVKGELRGSRWFCSPASLEQAKAAETTPRTEASA